MSSALSKEMQKFIDDNIHSVDELNVLLFLRSQPEKDWNAVEVAYRTHIDPISAADHLMSLYLKGLLGHQEHKGRFYSYRYRAFAKRKDQHVAQLAELFERVRADVEDYIFKSRKRQLEIFADTFNLKKDH